eukprot:CAMPEP_0202391542 /NCGR_PEP_ID=MMETSP1127-20130417/91891_1 /ASSEMBLY_ACC=CAM_ASM_000462 /TAXON_ID=3047 /ORGANISM="Dunaliella tertiolecta, Strain CCMP1320" /LENGTH=149 /DNA_ID=CAMNT_0048993979 /DNA_START=304 /DNA_END=753 /DNA_ORIENTATION=+
MPRQAVTTREHTLSHTLAGSDLGALSPPKARMGLHSSHQTAPMHQQHSHKMSRSRTHQSNRSAKAAPSRLRGGEGGHSFSGPLESLLNRVPLPPPPPRRLRLLLSAAASWPRPSHASVVEELGRGPAVGPAASVRVCRCMQAQVEALDA